MITANHAARLICDCQGNDDPCTETIVAYGPTEFSARTEIVRVAENHGWDIQYTRSGYLLACAPGHPMAWVNGTLIRTVSLVKSYV